MQNRQNGPFPGIEKTSQRIVNSFSGKICIRDQPNIHLCCCFQQKLKLGTREQEEVSRLCEEVQQLRAELGCVQGGLGAREARDRRELQTRLQSHQEVIADIKTELQYQVQSSYNETCRRYILV